MTAPLQTIIIKAVSVCNLACAYCSARCGGQAPRQVRPESVLTVFGELLENRRIGHSCKVLWHGGEPTLYDPEKADHIMSRLIAAGKQQDVVFDFIMQTNGFSIPPAWLELIDKYRIRIGISCDGPAPMHDSCRKTAAGAGSYENVMKTVRSLTGMGIAVSLLCVIDRRQEESVDAFYAWAAEQKLPVKLNPRFSDDMSPADFRKYFDFLCGFLRCYLRGEADFPVEPLGGLLRAVLNDSPAGECSFSGNCGKHILCIDHLDRISACGRFSDQNRFVYPIAAGRVAETVDEIRARAGKLLEERFARMQCGKCGSFKFCHAGCSAYLDAGNIASYCEAGGNFRDFMNGEALRLLKSRLLKERGLLLSQAEQCGGGEIP